MLKRWWFMGVLRPGMPAQRAWEPSKEEQQRILDEWETARARLERLVAARVTAVGDVLRAAELPVGAGGPDAPGPGGDARDEHDYTWVLDAFQAAGKLLDEAADLPDLAAAAVLAERALVRFAALHARRTGQPAPRPPERCWYNPLHTAAESGGPPARKQHRERARRRTGPREAAADRRPACPSCRKAILAGERPDVLPALVPVKVSRRRTARMLVPYYSVPQQWSLWSVSACGAHGDEWPGLVLRGEHRRRAAAAREA
ncbi:hypothetical protein A8W25_25415 [Streptomyces sp. ERV7]|uniref:hypothetical protein n=1 Tax=Streptomyces sp. ERV7 TaxID=1322334 RepID=UPI0007F403A7|nr:hypothetical protein [Streptomyces sp. ERV7]OAR22898.1 hypothetical protein A8W25_25415 [Streptomyces sp. ERV7]